MYIHVNAKSLVASMQLDEFAQLGTWLISPVKRIKQSGKVRILVDTFSDKSISSYLPWITTSDLNLFGRHFIIFLLLINGKQSRINWNHFKTDGVSEYITIVHPWKSCISFWGEIVRLKACCWSQLPNGATPGKNNWLIIHYRKFLYPSLWISHLELYLRIVKIY